MSELVKTLEALIKKESAECMLESAQMLEEAAQIQEMAKVDGRVALLAMAVSIRNEAGKVLSGAPPGNVFMELGKLAAEVERYRGAK